MRHAIGRVLWMVPSLAVVSVVAFVTLVNANASRGGPEADVLAERRLRELPLFFNPAPADVRSRSLAAVASIAHAEPDAHLAAQTLARLGGAALPHVLPTLETLSPSGRGRVALALMPVARRMQLAGERDVDEADEAVLFWQRMWEDRGLDFRPLVVRRSVRRAAVDASATRREELRELDTYALPELMTALAEARRDGDAPRSARVLALIAPFSGSCRVAGETASPAELRAAIATCRRWWSATGADYSALDGPIRLAAMISETQYGRWLGDAAWFGLGTTAEGRSVLADFAARGPITGLLLLAALLGGYAGGALSGLLASVRRGAGLELATTVLTVMIAALPPAVMVTWLTDGAVRGPQLGAAALAMALPTWALVFRHQRALTRRALREDSARTLIAFGAGPIGLSRGLLRNSSIAAASLLGADVPVLLTTAFVVERIANLDGLGAATVQAVENRDLAWLMALALVGCALVGFAQIASDALLAALDHRVRAALAPRQEGLE